MEKKILRFLIYRICFCISKAPSNRIATQLNVTQQNWTYESKNNNNKRKIFTFPFFSLFFNVFPWEIKKKMTTIRSQKYLHFVVNSGFWCCSLSLSLCLVCFFFKGMMTLTLTSTLCIIRLSLGSFYLFFFFLLKFLFILAGESLRN